jgi:hypothetical protein
MSATRNREHHKKEGGKLMHKAAETSGTAASVASNITMQLREAGTNYARALTEGGVASQKQHAEAAASYAEAKQKVEQEAAKRATEAYNEYTKAAQEAQHKENGQQLLADAYQNYATTVQGLHEDTTRRLTEAYGELVNKSNQAAADSARTSHEHYVKYLKHVQKVWATVDVEALIAPR